MDTKVIAVHTVCNAYSICILDYDDDECITWTWSNELDREYKAKIEYEQEHPTADMRCYFFAEDYGKIYLDECLRVNFGPSLAEVE